MIERLAIPASGTAPSSLETWKDALKGLGHETRVAKEAGDSWLDIPSIRVRGFLVFEGEFVEAINFEIQDSNAQSALETLATTASAIGWELHDEPDDDEE